MTRLFNEPLFHFLLFGAAIFAAYRSIPVAERAEPGRIVVSRARIGTLSESFTRTWRRPPSEQELAGLVRDHVREEVYYREALALGLDRDDTVVRRRLRQKMEFLTDDAAALREPSEEELSAYLAAHADAFRDEQRFSFRQVYLDRERRGEQLARDAARLLAQLNQAGAQSDPVALGDASLLEPELHGVAAGEVASLLGAEFAAQIGKLPLGAWQGPLESAYGAHLVLVSERSEGRLPALAEVRDEVRREWGEARRRAANERLYAALLARYVVTVEAPARADRLAAHAE